MKGKTVAVTGCTGGLGRELCLNLARLGANIIMLDRNPVKSENLEREILQAYNTKITRLTVELEDMAAVKTVTEKLIALKPDIFITNAGAYKIPRYICNSGYDNVFQINFVSHYYMIRSLTEKLESLKIVAVGSIAHTYSVIDENDIDFRTRKSCALAYGNSKRFLMLALAEHFKDSDRLSIVHPGITFTNITAHYPKIIFAIIKYPMKIIFHKAEKAVFCILEGVFQSTNYGMWIGPKFFGIWGRPKKQRLEAIETPDTKKAADIAELIYKSLSDC